MGFAQCRGFTLLRFCVEGLSIEKLSGFLVRGLCRLELPSEMFTCNFLVFKFGLFVCLEEGFVINVHIPNLCVYSLSTVNALVI